MANRNPRLEELGSILAAGIARLRKRSSEQQHCSGSEKVELDFTAEQSVCPTVSNEGGKA